jgi:hypothetical protein
LAITSFIIHDLDWPAATASTRLPHTATIRSLVCTREMRPQAFLDPSAFLVTCAESSCKPTSGLE